MTKWCWAEAGPVFVWSLQFLLKSLSAGGGRSLFCPSTHSLLRTLAYSSLKCFWTSALLPFHFILIWVRNAPFENCSIWEMLDLRNVEFEKCSIWELLQLRIAGYEKRIIWETWGWRQIIHFEKAAISIKKVNSILFKQWVVEKSAMCLETWKHSKS